MQPDKSYKVQIKGNGYASLDFVKEKAYKRANMLCPKGFDTKADLPSDTSSPSYVLIVMCKEN